MNVIQKYGFIITITSLFAIPVWSDEAPVTTKPAAHSKALPAKTGASPASKKPVTPKAMPAGISTLQEGWYKVMVGGQHTGYYVMRIEFDSATKQFVATTLLRTNVLGGNINESLKAYANEKMGPISYQYTLTSDRENKTIDATFNKQVMNLKITKNGETKTDQKQIRSGTFLSAFLIYTVLQNKAGLKVGNNYAYSAVAEEDGVAHNGEAFVMDESTVNSLPAFKIRNSFKNQKFISMVSATGTILSSKFPEDGIEMKLVATRDEAVGSIPVNEKALSILFGAPPAAQSAVVPASAATATEDEPKKPKLPTAAEEDKTGVPKGMSVPPGKGG